MSFMLMAFLRGEFTWLNTPMLPPKLVLALVGIVGSVCPCPCAALAAVAGVIPMGMLCRDRATLLCAGVNDESEYLAGLCCAGVRKRGVAATGPDWRPVEVEVEMEVEVPLAKSGLMCLI